MIVNPTMHFNGKCEEAIALYKKAFGCTVLTLLYTNNASDAPTSDGGKRVNHSEVDFGNIVVRMSDGLSEDNNPTLFPLFMALNFNTTQEVKNAAAVIEAAGGVVIEPFASYPFSACMGSIIDPYGFRWRIMVE